MLSASRRIRGANLSFLQCLILLILLCGIQIAIFEFYISGSSSCPSQTTNHAMLQSIYNPPPALHSFPITQKQHEVVINYLMDKNRRLASQIKDLIHHNKMAQLEDLDPTERLMYEPQPKPFKTMDDIQLLIPLPLIEDGIHESTFNWNARTFSDYSMCHFLSSNQYPNVQDHLDENNMNKINKFIKEHKRIPSHIRDIQQLLDIASFTISTYNTWNVNPPLDERMIGIAHVLAEYHVDVVALQEVRSTKYKNETILQHELILNELQTGAYHNKHKHGIGNYNGEKWNIAQGAVHLGKDVEEYLVIASRFEIERYKVYPLKTGKDEHRRILLYASIIIPTDGWIQHAKYVDVFHAHFGLNVPDQCVHVMEIVDIMNQYHMKNPDRLQVLLGDFNTYLDFEYPMDIITVDYMNKDHDLLRAFLHSKCGAMNTTKTVRHVGVFNDTWKEIYGDTVDVMRTFPNQIDHRIEDFTATDRILYRNGKVREDKRWQVCDVWIAGDQVLNIENEEVFPSDHRTVIAKMYYN